MFSDNNKSKVPFSAYDLRVTKIGLKDSMRSISSTRDHARFNNALHSASTPRPSADDSSTPVRPEKYAANTSSTSQLMQPSRPSYYSIMKSAFGFQTKAPQHKDKQSSERRSSLVSEKGGVSFSRGQRSSINSSRERDHDVRSRSQSYGDIISSQEASGEESVFAVLARRTKL
jgi:hypothetical protein